MTRLALAVAYRRPKWLCVFLHAEKLGYQFCAFSGGFGCFTARKLATSETGVKIMGDGHPTVRPQVTVSSLVRRKRLGSGLFHTNFERFHHEFLFHGMPVRALLELKAQIMPKYLFQSGVSTASCYTRLLGPLTAARHLFKPLMLPSRDQ